MYCSNGTLPMRYLSLMLLAPWLIVLAWAYWALHKTPARSTAQRIFDALAVTVAAVVSIWSALLAFSSVVIKTVGVLGPESGGIWKQVAPALYGYGTFVAVLVAAMLVRRMIWRRGSPS
jgi:hypothetical protein